MLEVKVSVIVPVYNKEKYLDECLISLTNQTLNDIEIICIDDGSTDNSLNILKKFSEKDSRIKIIAQSNHGPGHARNEGLIQAVGEYVAFIDADDWIELDSLEQLYYNAKENNSDLVLFNAIEYLPDEKFRKRIYYHQDIVETFNFHNRKDLVMNNFLIVCTKLHRLEFLRENNIYFAEFGLFEDVLFHIKSTVKSKNISYLNRIFYNYRRTETNSRQLKSIQSDDSLIFLDISKDIENFLVDEGVYNELEINFLSFKLNEIQNLFNTNKNKEYFFKQLKKDFNNHTIDDEILVQLPDKQRSFYRKIIKSKTLDDYNNPSTNKNTTKRTSIKSLIKKIF
jgi:glycosyltransferase involved in cell wall biosynthesis